jgi:hypothetical protein
MKWAEPILKEHERKTANVNESDNGNEEPHMLHLVYLTQPTRGRPWWEKQIIEALQLEGRVSILLRSHIYRHLIRLLCYFEYLLSLFFCKKWH